MRIDDFRKMVKRRCLDAALVFDPANIRALTGIVCDNACFTGDVFYTDFRYVPMVHRIAPELKVRDIRNLAKDNLGKSHRLRRIGFESSISQARYQELAKAFRSAKFVDVAQDLSYLRSVKTEDELGRIRAAVALNDSIWERGSRAFEPGMTELQMARIIRHLMVEEGDGEAFETIVCVGANAAECHHVPDETAWNGREPVLVDMGVKLNGLCSDMTRNLVPKRPRPLYKKVYEVVREANLAAIAAARPGITGAQLDKVARDVIRKAGFARCFGHSLGHGVGYEIHEAPYASKRGKTVLKPGMTLTIEPGVYLEGNLGVRIEDLVVITQDGCEVLTTSSK